MLFTLLTQNSNELVQERVSELLCQLCLYHKKYSDELLSSYWVEYFKKINDYESINLIIQIFKQINFNKSSILNDGRKIRMWSYGRKYHGKR